MKKHFFVYSIANKSRSVISVGFSGYFKRRLKQHIDKVFEGFTKKHNCTDILYYEKFENPTDGIAREKQIKKYRREKKNALIEKENPEYKSLNQRIFTINDKDL